MKIGVATYGMNVWYGGCYDVEQRLADLKAIGYDGVERLEASTEADAVHQAVAFRRLGMDFGLVRGPTVETTIKWTAALGKNYVWTQVNSREFDTFCRQVNDQARAAAAFGVKVGVHNHLGSPVESQSELEAFLDRCPDCGLILDTAHLAAAEGDPVDIARRYADRLLVLHVKDYVLTNPEISIKDNWPARGRFCELGGGNIGMDNAAVVKTVLDAGYDGWIFVEHDTHLRDPLEDLAHSREYLRQVGV